MERSRAIYMFLQARQALEKELMLSPQEVASSDEEMGNQVEVLPTKKERKYGNQKFFKVHIEFFIDCYDRRSTATLEQAKAAVMEAFPGLELVVSMMHEHLIKKCNLTLKKLEKLIEKHNDNSTMVARRERILERQELKDFDYSSNCVFIDKASFNMHIKRSHARSERGQPAKGTIPTQGGVSLAIIGAVCEQGIVNLTLRKPTAIATRKRRRTTFAGSVIEQALDIIISNIIIDELHNTE
ncbi:uncharacterized protein BX663DRAFT_556694 [Cokeromyces recurvatus]|uniref:uncharacterized protein n=1 Tax=Cokeromyces recurvatus TaxID=90255 RepID=UPI00222030D8|nr:uncharacterized protein BX663DRAFT_556694 [Cokeromyces recurvatus]KAI7897469.1 hypothetical protein BX663DRAFT_556694 [Cokeromyces recurvatus]